MPKTGCWVSISTYFSAAPAKVLSPNYLELRNFPNIIKSSPKKSIVIPLWTAESPNNLVFQLYIPNSWICRLVIE